MAAIDRTQLVIPPSVQQLIERTGFSFWISPPDTGGTYTFPHPIAVRTGTNVPAPCVPFNTRNGPPLPTPSNGKGSNPSAKIAPSSSRMDADMTGFTCSGISEVSVWVDASSVVASSVFGESAAPKLDRLMLWISSTVGTTSNPSSSEFSTTTLGPTFCEFQESGCPISTIQEEDSVRNTNTTDPNSSGEDSTMSLGPLGMVRPIVGIMLLILFVGCGLVAMIALMWCLFNRTRKVKDDRSADEEGRVVSTNGNDRLDSTQSIMRSPSPQRHPTIAVNTLHSPEPTDISSLSESSTAHNNPSKAISVTSSTEKKQSTMQPSATTNPLLTRNSLAASKPDSKKNGHPQPQQKPRITTGNTSRSIVSSASGQTAVSRCRVPSPRPLQSKPPLGRPTTIPTPPTSIMGNQMMPLYKNVMHAPPSKIAHDDDDNVPIGLRRA
jgi:hypothetical protein